MRAMRPALVVELRPAFDEHLCLGTAAEPFPVQQFVTQLAVAKVLDEPVCHGLPGAMKAGPIAASRSQRMILAAVKSAPLFMNWKAQLLALYVAPVSSGR